jgi:zinc and cadmium transporter
MQGIALLGVYCALAILISLMGGILPLMVRLTHRRMEIALSFVSGVMLGVALLHMLPHALAEMGAEQEIAAREEIEAHGEEAAVESSHSHDSHTHSHASGPVGKTMVALLAGFLAMFLIERFFSFHHHEAPGEGKLANPPSHGGCGQERGHAHHRLSWTGAAIGLTLHTLISGVALAASVESESGRESAAAAAIWNPWLWAGFPTFLVVVLHKPFDSLSIATLMAAGRHGARARHLVNFAFSLSIPAGVALFQLGAIGAEGRIHEMIGLALAFSAGTFLCIALSDLLPELQFHRHDRVWLSLALAAGLAVAWLSGAVG